MDHTILTLDEHDLDPSVDTKERDTYTIRFATRAVVTGDNNSIALLHAKTKDYFKLPGGGVEEGEDIPVALARELLEEIGSTAEVNQELGMVLEWRDFERLKQISYCFSAKLSSPRGKPTFTDQEIEEGFEITWTPTMEKAIELVSASVNSTDKLVSFMTRRDTAILQAAAKIQAED